MQVNTSAPAQAISGGNLHFDQLTLDALHDAAPLFVFLLDAAPLSGGISFNTDVTLAGSAAAQHLFFVVTNNNNGIILEVPQSTAASATGTWLAQGQGTLIMQNADDGGTTTAVGRLLSNSFAIAYVGSNDTEFALNTP